MSTKGRALCILCLERAFWVVRGLLGCRVVGVYDAKRNRACRLSYNLHGISRDLKKTCTYRFFYNMEIIVGRFICRSGLLRV